jgi:subtilisin family serine protease
MNSWKERNLGNTSAAGIIRTHNTMAGTLRRIGLLAVGASALVCAVPGIAMAAGADSAIASGDAVPGEVIVVYTNSASSSTRDNVANLVDANRKSSIADAPASVDLLKLPSGRSVDSAIQSLESQGAVAHAEPNYRIRAGAKAAQPPWSNDPLVGNGATWGLYGASGKPKNQFGSGAVLAWAAGITGSANVYVAVLDEGVQINHPDLSDNIFTNAGEVAGDGIDNDSNGYVDDVNGWDFINGDSTVYDGSTGQGMSEVDFHGTHVAGIIGATGGNGIGTSGVAQDVGIIPLKMLDTYEGGTVAEAIEALDYLTALKKSGVNIVASNSSWEGPDNSLALKQAIRRSGNAGVLFVTIAGNGDENGDAINTDATPVFPAGYTCNARYKRVSFNCIVTVTAINDRGRKPAWANYGKTSVDLGAPGVDILSLAPDSMLASDSGTSMAAPFVSGALALYASQNPGAHPAAMRAELMSSTQPTKSLKNKTASGGRLSIPNLLDL